MNQLGVETTPSADPLTDPLVKDVLIMLASEVQEALNPLTIASKPWKAALPEDLKRELMSEVTDVVFFYMELMIVLGITAGDLEEMYLRKFRHILRHRLDLSEHVVEQVITQARYKIQDKE